MGDIYHEIKNVVDKLSGAYKRRSYNKNVEEKEIRTLADSNTRHKLKMSDSEESF